MIRPEANKKCIECACYNRARMTCGRYYFGVPYPHNNDLHNCLGYYPAQKKEPTNEQR